MAKPFDATTKHLIEEHPSDWLAFVGIKDADAVPIRSDVSTVTAEADQVLQINGPPPWLVHLELQASYDPDLDARVLQYNVLLDRHHGLPVQSVVVLLRKEAGGPRLTGHLVRRRPDGADYLDFRYQVIRVWEQPVESLLRGGLGTLPLAPICNVQADALPDVVQQMHARIEREATRSEAAWLWTATNILMGLRYSPSVAARLLQGVRVMKESSTYQAIVAEGARETLLRIGTRRFGPAGAAVRMALESIDSPERLERLAERILDVESWDDLLAGA